MKFFAFSRITTATVALRVSALAPAIVIAGATSAANADQPQTITISTEAKPILIDGKLQGCALNFEAGRNDTEYSGGELVYLTGSLNLYSFDRQTPFFALKLGVKTTKSSGFTPPADAFLVDGNETNKSDFAKSVNADTSGFRLFMFNANEMTLQAAVGRVVENDMLTIAYAMRPGGTNAVVPLNLKMRQFNFNAPDQSIMNNDLKTQWMDCIHQVVDNVDKPPRP